VIAAFITMGALFTTFWDFRRRVLNARRGIYTFRKKDARIYMDTNFMGGFIATTIVGYIIVVLVVTVVMVVIVWDISRELIWSMRSFIFWTLAVPQIINLVQNMFLRKFFFGDDFIRHRPLASIYMFWQCWLSFLAGIASAIVRIALGVVGIVLSMPQMMAACTPAFMNQLVCLDAAYKQYLGAVLVYHTHCNPVVHVAVQRLLALGRERRRQISEGAPQEAVARKSLWRTKRLIILLLVKHPWLSQFRKAAIYEREAKEKAEEKLKKQQKGLVAKHQKPSSDERRLIQAIHSTKMMNHAGQSRIKMLEDRLSELRMLPIGSPEAMHLVEAALGAANDSNDGRGAGTGRADAVTGGGSLRSSAVRGTDELHEVCLPAAAVPVKTSQISL